ncbi:uncharacterized protein L203_102129 [Cryptococcus depauperatus CBS 7841]|uniref:SAGA-associated factor 11 n=1 Tax=Cryptococcus depauperatus CBS 7841 TaxID=1295531 RepID=A0AAJ8JR75_9TREE
MTERQKEIHLAAQVVLQEMIDDLILTTAISAHREIKRGRVICGTCGTRCRDHQPLFSSNTVASSSLQLPLTQDSGSSSRAQTPQLNDATGSRTGGHPVGPEKGMGGTTGIGSGSGRADGSGNNFFDCLVCSRPIASNRYAPHLSRCLGLNGSTRRVTARSAAVKARFGNGQDRSSPSPFLGSENGEWNSDTDSIVGGKRKKINGSTRRNSSPNKMQQPKGKKTKLIGSSSGTPTPQLPRQVLPPSKLGRPPTNSVILSSPDSSPEKSVVSIASSLSGMTGTKTLPGTTEIPTVPGDDSSEGADDY